MSVYPDEDFLGVSLESRGDAWRETLGSCFPDEAQQRAAAKCFIRGRIMHHSAVTKCFLCQRLASPQHQPSNEGGKREPNFFPQSIVNRHHTDPQESLTWVHVQWFLMLDSFKPGTTACSSLLEMRQGRACPGCGRGHLEMHSKKAVSGVSGKKKVWRASWPTVKVYLIILGLASTGTTIGSTGTRLNGTSPINKFCTGAEVPVLPSVVPVQGLTV